MELSGKLVELQNTLDASVKRELALQDAFDQIRRTLSALQTYGERRRMTRAPVPNAPVQVRGTTQLQVRSAGGTGGQAPSPGGYPVRPQPSNPDIAKPEPEDLAGPP